MVAQCTSRPHKRKPIANGENCIRNVDIHHWYILLIVSGKSIHIHTHTYRITLSYSNSPLLQMHAFPWPVSNDGWCFMYFTYVCVRGYMRLDAYLWVHSGRLDNQNAFWIRRRGEITRIKLHFHCIHYAPQRVSLAFFVCVHVSAMAINAYPEQCKLCARFSHVLCEFANGWVLMNLSR